MKRIFLLVSLLCLGLLNSASAQEIAERSTPELLRYGKVLFDQGECFSARYLYQQVLERDPENIEALSGKGQALVCEGTFAEGITALEKAVSLAPNAAALRLALARAHIAMYENDPSHPSRALARALDAVAAAGSAKTPKGQAQLDNLRGVIYYRQSKLPEAKTALTQAVKRDPRNADYLRSLGLVLLQLGDGKNALHTFREAVQLEPDNALGHNQLGQTYLLQGDCDNAVYELSQALTLEPDVTAVNYNLARAQFDCKLLGKAKIAFEKVIALEPTAFPSAYTYLARISIAGKNYDDAVTQATKGALLPPASAEAYYWLGQAYGARSSGVDASNDTDKAKEAYNRALEIQPQYQQAQQALDALP